MNISQQLKNQIYFVIPAYNEAKVIANVLKDLKHHGFSNLVVTDDGSTDNTAEKVNSVKGVTLLPHVINRGQGAAIRTGIGYALQQPDCKYIVTFDSDGQHRISDLPNMITLLEQGKCDIVLGSRF